MFVYIVKPSSPRAKEACKKILKGSAMVMHRGILYYEGGLYQREPSVRPTEKQFLEYVFHAVDRAVTSYPTIAKVRWKLIYGEEWEGDFTIIGRVLTDCRPFEVHLDKTPTW